MKEKSSAPSECYCDAMGERRQCDAAGFCLMDLAVKINAKKYRHLKRGGVYELVGIATLQNSSLAFLGDDSDLVIYSGEDGSLHARLLEEFYRFEEVK